MKIYTSKKDWVLGIVIWTPLLVAFILSVYTREYAAIIITGLVCLLVATIWFGTSYTIDHDKLRVRTGIFSYAPIPIATIKLLENTSTMLASPACSFDRLLLKYGKYDEIVISPDNKTAFIEDLKRINPSIQLSE